MGFFMVIFIVWIILSILIGNMGDKRQIGYWAGVLTSLFFSPIIGYIVVSLSAKKTPRNVRIVNQSENKFSVSDEIMKLKELLDDGTISKEDFDKQKSKLLD